MCRKCAHMIEIVFDQIYSLKCPSRGPKGKYRSSVSVIGNLSWTHYSFIRITHNLKILSDILIDYISDTACHEDANYLFSFILTEISKEKCFEIWSNLQP